MIVVYEKGTNEFVGMAPQIFDNGVMREFKLEELYPQMDHSKLGYFYVEDSPKYDLDRKNWQWTRDKAGTPIGIEFRRRLTVALSTDKLDRDGDGRYELLARVTEAMPKDCIADISIQLMDGIKQAKVEAEIKLTTTAGILTSRTVKTDKRGKATTRLMAGPDTIYIAVEANVDGGNAGTLEFEVLWIDEYNRLKA